MAAWSPPAASAPHAQPRRRRQSGRPRDTREARLPARPQAPVYKVFGAGSLCSAPVQVRGTGGSRAPGHASRRSREPRPALVPTCHAHTCLRGHLRTAGRTCPPRVCTPPPPSPACPPPASSALSVSLSVFSILGAGCGSWLIFMFVFTLRFTNIHYMLPFLSLFLTNK